MILRSSTWWPRLPEVQLGLFNCHGWHFSSSHQTNDRDAQMPLVTCPQCQVWTGGTSEWSSYYANKVWQQTNKHKINWTCFNKWILDSWIWEQILSLSLTSMVNKIRFRFLGFYIANFSWVCEVDVELHLFKDEVVMHTPRSNSTGIECFSRMQRRRYLIPASCQGNC